MEPDYAVDAMKVDYRCVLCPRKLQRGPRVLSRTRDELLSFAALLDVIFEWHFVFLPAMSDGGSYEFMRGHSDPPTRKFVGVSQNDLTDKRSREGI